VEREGGKKKIKVEKKRRRRISKRIKDRPERGLGRGMCIEIYFLVFPPSAHGVSSAQRLE